MTTMSSDIVQGTLTGPATQDTIRTADSLAEYHVLSLTNYSGSSVDLEIWVNGVADQNRVSPPDLTLISKETFVIHIKLGNTDTIRAEASAATAIAWTDEMDLLESAGGGGGFLVIANNLSDLANVATAVTNLGLVAGGAHDIWVEKAGDTMTGDLFITSGKLGIGTADVPHGGVGAGIFAIEGANASVAAGPHAQFTTAGDNYPLLQMLNYSHDNVSFLFDMYYDGSWRSSDLGSNFIYQKSGDAFVLRSYSGVAAGAVIPSWRYNQRWESNGDCTMGKSSAGSAQLHIEQSSPTGAKPVLLLDQADVSEEMMELASTVGVGNAIEAVGAKTLTTTHFIKVTITGVGARYFPVGTIA